MLIVSLAVFLMENYIQRFPEMYVQANCTHTSLQDTLKIQRIKWRHIKCNVTLYVNGQRILYIKTYGKVPTLMLFFLIFIIFAFGLKETTARSEDRYIN